MRIVPRADWGARPARGGLITQARPNRAYLHHTVGYGKGGVAYMRQMQNQHMDDNGWRDIAYNFILDPNTGVWYEGRGALKIPGAQKNHNTGTIALCVMGNWHTTNPNWRVVEWVADMMRHVYAKAWGPQLLTGGHRDAPGQQTLCPGDLLHARIPEINALIHHPPGGTMQYRNFVNVPTERNANGERVLAGWAVDVIDWALATRRALPDLTYDWEKPITDGRYFTIEYRGRA